MKILIQQILAQYKTIKYEKSFYFDLTKDRHDLVILHCYDDIMQYIIILIKYTFITNDVP